MIYRKLKRMNSYGHSNYIPRLKETFPELSKVDSEELADRWDSLGLDFSGEEKKAVSFWRRLTLPLGIIVLVLLFIGLPINFMITGHWGYSLGKKNYILNWLRSLRLQ